MKPPLRSAIRQQRKITLSYRDLREASSERTVWPFALGYFEQVRVLVAWCELRQDFRHFRVDRISQLTLEQTGYPRSRAILLKEWRATQQIPQPKFIADRN
jgi:predicted DNA-binding transcriptional regulator YafY